VKAASSRGGAVFVTVPGFLCYVYLKAIKILRRKKEVKCDKVAYDIGGKCANKDTVHHIRPFAL
jgi:hypothetical protein